MKYLKLFESDSDDLVRVAKFKSMTQVENETVYGGDFIKYQILGDSAYIEVFGLDDVEVFEIIANREISKDELKTILKNCNKPIELEDENRIVLKTDEFTIYLNSKNETHREDGPAIEYVNGDKYWYLNGELHREDGPAVEYDDGNKYWYLNGHQISQKEMEDYLKRKSSNLTKEMVDDIVADLLDEFNSVENSIKLGCYEFNLSGGNPKSVYLLLSEIESRLKQYNYKLGAQFNGDNLLSINIF